MPMNFESVAELKLEPSTLLEKHVMKTCKKVVPLHEPRNNL